MNLVRSVVVLAALAVVQPAWSQVTVYADFTAAQISTAPGTNYLYGPTIGVTGAFPAKHHFVLAGDLRTAFLYQGGQEFDSMVVGPRLSLDTKFLAPYVEGMVGFGRYNDGLGTTSSASTDALIEGNFGLDHRVTKRLDWRVIDLGYEQFFEIGNRIHPWTYSTGVVFHLGSR